MTTIIVVSAIVIVFLMVIGTVKRKEIALLFRAEVNEIIEKNTDNHKIAKVKLKDMKANRENLIDAAADLEKEIRTQSQMVTKLKEECEEHLNKAKKYKESNDIPKAKSELATKKIKEKQIETISETILLVQQNQAKLEKRIYKLNTLIIEYDLKLKTQKARRTANKALASVQSKDVIGNDIEDNIELAEESIDGADAKLSYMESFDNDEEDESDSEVDAEFDKL